MKSCICYLTYNRFLYTKESLQSIIDNTNRSDYELIIWDNGSSNDMLDWLRDICIKNNFKYIYFKKNQGLTRAMNNQMYLMNKIHSFDVFCHIANDIVVPKNWLDGIFEAIQIPKVGVVGLNLEPGKYFEKEVINGVELEKIEPIGNLTGAHFCIPKRTYDLIGNFMKVSFGYGQQDANYSLEVKLLPDGLWDYYLPHEKYKAIELKGIYWDYEQKQDSFLRRTGTDITGGRDYRNNLKQLRARYDAKQITREQMISIIKQQKEEQFDLVDMSQLLETNMETVE